MVKEVCQMKFKLIMCYTVIYKSNKEIVEFEYQIEYSCRVLFYQED